MRGSGLLSDGVRFPSREEKEQLRNKLQGLTVEEVEPGRGYPEVPSEVRDATKNEAKNETETENESEAASVSDEGKAVGEAPTAKKRVRKERKLRTLVILDGLVTFVEKKAGSWKGLKDKVVARRLNRIRVGERCKQCRNLEATEIAIGRGAQLISQLAKVDVAVEDPPVYGAQPAKTKRGKKRKASGERSKPGADAGNTRRR